MKRPTPHTTAKPLNAILNYARPLALSVVLASIIILPLSAAEHPAPHNIIIMISDGFGPTALTAAREYWGNLTLDSILVGTIRTRSYSSAVTDSAAGGTAYATGVRTYNRAVSVDPDKQPLTTLLEEARDRGMATGLVVTSAIAHATPAVFSAHVVHRKLMYDIAAQQAKEGIDLLLGGGLDDWLPVSKGGCRNDGRDLIQELRTKGYHQATFKHGVLNVESLPAIGLFAMGNMDYVIDHNDASGPTLTQMAVRAVELLSKRPQGFFLMIEGSRIDHAEHVNDPTTALHEIKAYDDTVKAVLKFAREDGRTLVVSVSDHETGGMSLGRRIGNKSYYSWRPEVLKGGTASTARIADRIIDGAEPLKTVLKYSGLKALNEQDRGHLIKLSKQARAAGRAKNECSTKWRGQDLARHLSDKSGKKITPRKRLMYWLGERISREALIGWTTYAHTGVDINLYAFGPDSEKFRGNHNNTAVARIIADVMGFRRIQAQAKRWMSRQDSH